MTEATTTTMTTIIGTDRVKEREREKQTKRERKREYIWGVYLQGGMHGFYAAMHAFDGESEILQSHENE